MRISITGTPGSGKHSIARQVAEKLKFELIDLGTFAKEQGFIIPDEKRHTLEVNVPKIRELLMDKKDVIFVSNYAELIPADLVLVIRCHPKELARRLVERDYSIDKIKENLEVECLDYCLQEALSHHQVVGEVDNTENLDESVQMAIDIIDGKRKAEYGTANFLEYVDKLDELIEAGYNRKI